MTRFMIVSAFALCLTGALVHADGTEDGLKEGDAIGVFYVTKVAGAQDDGVEPGDDLCYRCRYGSQPMVMVFTRRVDGKVPELLRQLDAAVSEREEDKLKGLLTLLGDDTVALKQEAQQIAKAVGAKHVPVVIAKDTKTGPLNYRLPNDADVTIVVARDSQVVSTHVFEAEKVDLVGVMKQVRQMLN